MSAGEAGAVSGGGEVVVETAVRNVGGLHTRPAAVIAELLAGFAATVTLAVPGKEPATAASAISIAILAAAPGTLVRITGTGPDARAAVEDVRELIEEGFGEELARARWGACRDGRAVDKGPDGPPPPRRRPPPPSTTPPARSGSAPVGSSARSSSRRRPVGPAAAERLPEDDRGGPPRRSRPRACRGRLRGTRGERER